MAEWILEFLPQAKKDLAQCDREVRRRIIDKLEWLVKNFDVISPSVLAGEFKDFQKLRVGDWRIIYKTVWEKRKIFVCYIDKRDKIYK